MAHRADNHAQQAFPMHPNRAVIHEFKRLAFSYSLIAMRALAKHGRRLLLVYLNIAQKQAGE
jgi:hypothetical protein